MQEPKSVGLAYLFWLAIFLGLAGLHRFYVGKWGTGLLWLCTGGLLGIGQLVDLILIPSMVEKKNLRLWDQRRLYAPVGGARAAYASC